MIKKGIISIFVLCVLGVIIVPIPSTDMDYSHVLYDRNGQLLSAKIASDQQWRFPLKDDIPEQLEQAILLFEDEYFHRHVGINPVSIIKATRDNIRAGKIVRGGSTITMQVMRMARAKYRRTFVQKFIELFGAVKLEILYSKEDILKMWASMAPMGGNTVGMQTAAQRYFQRNIEDLSISEYATLAVLPNAPSQIHVNKNRVQLKKKRDFLLDKLFDRGIIDSTSLVLAKSEDIVQFDQHIDQNAWHFLEYLRLNNPDKSNFHSTINRHLQRDVQRIADNQAVSYRLNGIGNIAAIVIDNQTNELLAYVGNINKDNKIQYVDCAQGLRSYGSLLKPFLYAFAMNESYLLPHEQIKDIPTVIDGFAPQNFDRKFRGSASMEQIVAQSLNVPAVRALNYVGLESFHKHLYEDLNVKTLSPDANHHGLSLILGGGEATLWDMTRIYKGLIRDHYQYDNPYNHPTTLRIEPSKNISTKSQYDQQISWHTLQAMKTVNRPPEEQAFAKLYGEPIAWKTGTSYGHRDAWSIGSTPRYTVGVWVGNEDGKGMYGLTGVQKAAPILFKIFRMLNASKWEQQLSPAKEVHVCHDTGKLAGSLCKDTYSIMMPKISHKLRTCQSHQIAQNADTLYIPDATVSYYQSRYTGISERTHIDDENKRSIKCIYPRKNSIVYVPKKIDQAYSKVILSAESNYKGSTLYWYLDGKHIGTTTDHHELPTDLSSGQHQLHINDQYGNEDQVTFEVGGTRVS